MYICFYFGLFLFVNVVKCCYFICVGFLKYYYLYYYNICIIIISIITIIIIIIIVVVVNRWFYILISGDYDVPQGTMVLLNLWMMHHDPDNWTDPEAFKPERFLDENGALAPKPESWLPFSAGRRVCLGESVAKPEILLLLAGYMRQFKISLPDGVKPDFEAIGGGFVRTPKPFKLIFEERD